MKIELVMNKFVKFSMCCLAVAGVATVQAQVNAADSVMQHVKGNKLSVGGYGEVAYSIFLVIMLVDIVSPRNIRTILAMVDSIFLML